VKRRFLLKHPNKFPEAQWRSFVAQCRVWRATIEATVANWDDLSMGRLGMPRPTYSFAEPELSADLEVASITVDGELAPVVRAVLEPGVPDALVADFPIWFRLELQTARCEDGEEPSYTPVLDPERARELKESPLFKK
jgi:hypothetical protein